MEFIEELRLEYERRERASESLAKKTKDLLTISGIIATLMVGFYGSFTNLTEFQIDSWTSLSLFSVILMLLTVILCIWSNRVGFRQTVLLGSNLTKGSKTDFGIIKSWTKATKGDYYEAIIDEYVKCLKNAEEEIEHKATRLTVAMSVFTIGLAPLPALLIIAPVLTSGA